MSQVKATFSGSVVAEPESKQVGGNNLLQFPVYVNHQRKNKDTGEYDRTGDVTKIRVTLWRDLADTDIRKGDIVEVDATLIEKEFPKQDGTTGRQLQTDFINPIVVKWRDPNAGAPVAPVAAEQSFAGFAGAPAGFL